MDYNDWKEEMNRGSFVRQGEDAMNSAEQIADAEAHTDKIADAAAGAEQSIDAAVNTEQSIDAAVNTEQSIDAAVNAEQGMDAAVKEAEHTLQQAEQTADEPVELAAHQTGAAGDRQPETITYSWVNPKLQTSRNANQSQSGTSSDYRWSDPGAQQRRQAGQSYYGGQSGAANRTSNAWSGGAADRASNTWAGNMAGAESGTGTQNASGTQNRAGGLKNRRMRRTAAGTAKPARAGRGWMRTVAMALVFGLIAGSVMFGVNRAGTAIFGSGEQKADVAASQSYTKLATTRETTGDNLSDSLDDSTRTEGEKAYAGTVAEVAQNAMPSLVTISTMSVQEMQSFFGGTEAYEVEGAGTGVIVGQNDTELLIATNNHVVEGATEVSVGFVDDQVVEAFIKGTDPSNDLAVVGVRLSDIPEETMNEIKIIAIGNSDDLVLGEQVVAIGNALGYGQSVTSGYVSAFDRELELSDGASTFVSSNLIQTDAAINSGNSGGALLNMRGELVGINEAKSSGSGSGASVDNVGYSIPISKAEPILEELMNLETKEKVAEEEKGYLGIRCADVNQETSERYNIPVGVYVREIADDSPASDAGLVVGDVITKVDGKIVSAYSDLEAALNYCRAGETIEVIIQRQESGVYSEETLSITLGKAAVLEGLSDDGETERTMPSAPYGD